MTDTVVRPGEETRRGETWAGKNVPRKEDERLLRGQGVFVDDVQYHNTTYVHFVRSPYGHARIKGIDVTRAEELSGVVCTMAGDEVVELSQPFFQIAPSPGGDIKDYPLAVGKARFVGEPVVAVVGRTREIARDGADLVEVEYEPLPAVVDTEGALDPDAPLVHDEAGSNLAWHGVFDYGDIDAALQKADHVVEIDRLHFHRFASTPIETNGAVAHYDPGARLYTIHCNNQLPGIAITMVASSLGVPFNSIQLVSRDIGGAFGNKINSYTYLTLLAMLAKKAKRPVKWTEYRSEQIAASGHGNERVFRDIKVPVMNDGTILGFEVSAIDDAGAYLRYEPLGGVIWAQVVPGCYRFKDIRVDFKQVISNKGPVSPNRGYSRMQHLWLTERIVDIVGDELGLDPVEVRKKNYVRAEDFPYETPNKCVYDSGDYERCLDMALDLIDYPSWRKEQDEARGTGRLIGIGIGSTLDSGTNNFGQSRIINPAMPFSGNNEAANAKLDMDGSIVVTLGSVPQGQSHETTAAQVVADVLGVAPDDVAVLIGQDMQRNVYAGFSGTIASQFAVTGLGAALGAAEKLRAEIVRLAAAVLGAEEDEIVLENGAAVVDEDRSIPFAGLAGLVHFSTAEIPPGFDEVTLNCNYIYRPPFEVPDLETKTGNLTLTYATQIHACVVEIDAETGQTKILDYAAVDDCGKRINPRIIDGQVHGAVVHGIGAVLGEALEYDEDGQLLNTNFYDYKAATAADVPHIKTGAIESPSPFSPNGAKGMGEGGGAALHTLCSAIQDALRGHGGGVVTDSHNPSERVYSLLHEPDSSGVRVNGRQTAPSTQGA